MYLTFSFVELDEFNDTDFSMCSLAAVSSFLITCYWFIASSKASSGFIGLSDRLLATRSGFWQSFLPISKSSWTKLLNEKLESLVLLEN